MSIASVLGAGTGFEGEVILSPFIFMNLHL